MSPGQGCLEDLIVLSRSEMVGVLHATFKDAEEYGMVPPGTAVSYSRRAMRAASDLAAAAVAYEFAAEYLPDSLCAEGGLERYLAIAAGEEVLT